VIEGTLVASSNSGRYAIDDPIEGHDLTAGEVIEILLGGQWIKGSIEHAPYLYAIETIGRPAQRGYYFIASEGGVSGLCVGMKVRITK
jgi:hypothetical protein